MKSRPISEVIADLRAMLDGTYTPPPEPYVDLDKVALFAGLTGVVVKKPIELIPGLLIQPSCAHFFSHLMGAFNLPGNSRTPHLAPWHVVRGGAITFDVSSELVLSEGTRVGNFSRLNSIWLVVSLIRLLSGVPIRAPAISSVAFGDIVSGSLQPSLWAVETRGHFENWTVDLDDDFARVLTGCIPQVAKLMEQPIFNRAYRTFDAVVWLPNLSAKMVAIWTAMETAMRPGRGSTTKKLAKALRSYLGTDRSSGDRIYNQVLKLYGERSNYAHDAQPPSPEMVRDSYLLARLMFTEIIGQGALPDAQET